MRHYFLGLRASHFQRPDGTREYQHNPALCGTGAVYGITQCMELWAFIRHYMEDDPATLPRTRIQPVHNRLLECMVERGAYSAITFGKKLDLDQLHIQQGKPEIPSAQVFWSLLSWPALLLAILRTAFRPVVKLPPQWQPDPNASRSGLPGSWPTAHDIANKYVAARYLKRWSAGLIGGGMLLYFLVILWVKHVFP
ncbi:hypothetical protein ACTSKR_08015 [Chitinibacteraceae bacterium HSL-7]